VGDIKVTWHRSRPPESRVKTVTVKREAGHWSVRFSIEWPEPGPLPASTEVVGIDVGLTSFLVTDTGDQTPNPRHFGLAERALGRAQRTLARRKRRSRRRQKARQEVARLHTHVRKQRLDFHHTTARSLVLRFGRIAVEDLTIKGLAGSMLAKSVHDAGGSQFLRILAYTAESAGRLLVVVNPAGTSQACSACGVVVPKTLADRWHTCPDCGLSLGRDHNAARNILHRAQGLGWSFQGPTVGVARAVA